MWELRATRMAVLPAPSARGVSDYGKHERELEVHSSRAMVGAIVGFSRSLSKSLGTEGRQLLAAWNTIQGFF
jgi:hypothetical protein